MVFVPRYSPTIPVEAEKIMFEQAIALCERNENSEFDLEDIVSRYATRYLKKLKYFRSDRFSLEQFIGLQCNNVNAEIMNEVIESKDRRSNYIWMDEALEMHGEEVTTEQIFTEEAEAKLMRKLLIEDVRETIARLNLEDRKIAYLHLRLGSLRQVESALGVYHGVFHRDIWPKFCSHFKEIWVSEKS